MKNAFTVLILWISGLTAAGQFAKFSVLFPDIQALYPQYESSVGFLVSVIGFLGIILGLIAGLLVARVGYRRMLIAALVFGAAISFYQSFVPKFELMMISRVLEGISHLAIVVSAPTLIGQISKGPYQGLAMTLWSTFFGVAFAIVAWVGIPLSAEQGPGSVFIIHAGVMIFAAGLLFFVLPPDQIAEEKPSFELAGIISAHRNAYSSPFLSAPAWGWLFYTLSFVSLLTVLPTLVPVDDRSEVAALMPLASIAVALLTGIVILRFLDPIRSIVTGFFLSILVLAFIWSGSELSLFAVVLFGTLGLVQGSSFAAIPYLNPKPEHQALANGALAQAGNLGNTLGTPLLLMMLNAFGINGLLFATAVLYIAAIGVHSFLARKRKAEAAHSS